MARLKLALDTNIVVDFLKVRQPYYESARKLMICGRVGEFELYVSSSQFTDLIHILSNGGQSSRMPQTLKSLKKLRTFVDVLPIGPDEIDTMLDSTWSDPEDFLLFECAVRNRADALITRNAKDFESDLIPVFDCDELFVWLEERFGLVYDEVDL